MAETLEDEFLVGGKMRITVVGISILEFEEEGGKCGQSSVRE